LNSHQQRKERIMRRIITGTLALVLTLIVVVANQPSRLLAAQEIPLAALAAQDLSLAQAQSVLDAAIAAAEEQGTKMDVAVVDAGGNLKAFARMDGAWLGSIDIATTKARTARYFDLPTEELGALSQPGGPLYGIEVSNGGLITFPGGLPLRAEDGTVIGAIGVSGSTVEDDRAVATAGAAALGGPNAETTLTDLPANFAEKSGGGGALGGVVN
jgi:uncharacterized protein GlcG (DUF336 family)